MGSAPCHPGDHPLAGRDDLLYELASSRGTPSAPAPHVAHELLAPSQTPPASPGSGLGEVELLAKSRCHSFQSVLS